jgi:hypothetical protein
LGAWPSPHWHGQRQTQGKTPNTCPHSDLDDGREEEVSIDDEEKHSMLRLERERFARAIELSMAVGEGNQKSFRGHGREPGLLSKFRAKVDGEDSRSESESDDQSMESEEEDTSTPTLISEALNAGFSLEQIKIAEVELDSPQQSSTQVCSNLKQGSISQLIDVWTANRKVKG